MSKAKCIPLFLTFFSWVCLSLPLSAVPSLTVRDTMRSIERLQDAFISGDQDAGKLSSRLMVQIETDITNSSVAELQNRKNVFSVIIFLMSGGNPVVVEKAFRNVNVDEDQKNLLAGAIAYARNDRSEALSKLSLMSGVSLPLNIQGRLLLVRAILVSETDVELAISLLLKARFLMPGTIVEEGALRRCSSYAEKLGDESSFKQCSLEILNRFQNSPYWQEFMDGFTKHASSIDEKKDPDFSLWFTSALRDLPPPVQVEMFLSTASSAVTNGNFLFGKLCASRASSISDAASESWMRAALYGAAAMIGLNDFETATKNLRSVKIAQLKQDDQMLYKKAANVLEQIVAETQAENNLPDIDPEKEEDPQFASYQVTISNAENMLKVLGEKGVQEKR